MLDNKTEDKWTIEKMCIDQGNYALSVEKQKTHWGCDQKRESWKWNVSYHGTITAQGAQNSAQSAKDAALASLPISEQ